MRRVDAALVALGVLATVAAGIALAFAADASLTGEVYVFALAVLTAAWLVTRIAFALPPSDPAKRPRPQRPPERIVQLESLARTLELAEASSFDLHNRLRPILREVAAARLARRGVSLDRQPERARDLLGVRAWELVRPDREPPAVGRLERGWSAAELRDVVDSLEAV